MRRGAIALAVVTLAAGAHAAFAAAEETVSGAADGARVSALFGGTMFVNMFSAADERYVIGRYVNRSSTGLRLAAGPGRCHLAWPSVTRDAGGEYWLYASEYDCRSWSRIVAFRSTDGVHFRRAGTALSRLEGDEGVRSSYVVFDSGIFRAWFVLDRRGVVGRQVAYAESRDGLHFKRLGSAKTVARRDVPADTLAIDVVFRGRRRWHLLYTGFTHGGQRAHAGVLSFDRARQRRYGHGRVIAQPRPRLARLAERAETGGRTLRLGSGHGFATGDPVVLPNAALSEAEPATVGSAGPRSVSLVRPLRLAHEAGARLVAADARKLSPSYVCRAADGSLRGLFTLFGAVSRVTTELTAAYRAQRLRGPWRLDRTRAFPVLSPWTSTGFYTTVENPTRVSRGPALPRCRLPRR